MDFKKFREYFLDNFSPDDIILEIGAGYQSTKFFSENFNKMYSIESEKRYCDLFHKNYLHVPLSTDKWYDADVLEQVIPNDYTVIFLDGPAGGYDAPFVRNDKLLYRSGFYKKSWDVFKHDVPIIVDDINRDWHERDVVDFLVNNGYSKEEHETFCVCRPK